MMEYIYLYEPRNSDPQGYRNFDDAVKQLCADNHCENVEDLFARCEEDSVYVEESDHWIYVDDGGLVRRIKLR